MKTRLFSALETGKIADLSFTSLSRSAIPLILRDMGPPSGSVFDPRVVWEKEKTLYEQRKSGEAPGEAR